MLGFSGILKLNIFSEISYTNYVVINFWEILLFRFYIIIFFNLNRLVAYFPVSNFSADIDNLRAAGISNDWQSDCDKEESQRKRKVQTELQKGLYLKKGICS